MTYRNLNVLEAAERAADAIGALLDRHPQQLLHTSQLRRSTQSMVGNIGEALGRRPGRDRVRSLEIARGETEETIRHLAANFRTNRLTPREYWPVHHLLVTISKMLAALIRRGC